MPILHAAAGVKNEADRNRALLLGETHDSLLDIIFKNSE
jgi:hypothetical protein